MAAPTDRTRLRRRPKRGRHDRATIHAILDAQPLCHVGYVVDGYAAVTPTLAWRDEDHVYWHGASASRAVRAAEGLDVCLTVSILDGLVLARSAFHHSANYRSVMVFGRARLVPDDDQERVLELFLERLYPGRWPTLRPVRDNELKATTVLALSLDEVSAKIREGGPVDDEPDYALPIWAGVLPLRTVAGPLEPDPRNLPDVEPPELVNRQHPVPDPGDGVLTID